jgi:hypothetical protein
MGFYDCQCMITGVSLKGDHAVAVLLQQTDETYHPIALGIEGAYNRLGSIDMISVDDNAEIVLAYFRDRLQDGTFVVEEEYVPARDLSASDALERLLGGFERNINDCPTTAVLAGRPVVLSLISQTIWEALMHQLRAPQGSPPIWFERIFGDNPVAAAIYQGKLTRLAAPLREMVAITAFLAERGLSWHPDIEPFQHYQPEMQQMLAEARQTFADSSAALHALAVYESDMADLLKDEPDEEPTEPDRDGGLA